MYSNIPLHTTATSHLQQHPITATSHYSHTPFTAGEVGGGGGNIKTVIHYVMHKSVTVIL